VTTTPLSEEYLAARAESCKLLGLDPDDLTPFEAIRCDVLTCLRLWLDSGQGQLLAGGNVDPAKLLAVSEALTKFVPAESEHKSRHDDPREYMWRTYLEMRHRGELGDRAAEPTLRSRLTALEAENESLRAALGAGSRVSAAAIPPEVVPPGEWRGVPPMAGPDDPKRPVVIEGKATPAPAAPAADVVDLRATRSNGAGGSAGFRNGPPNEGWRNFVKVDWQG
jgi:hypothetical protein